MLRARYDANGNIILTEVTRKAPTMDSEEDPVSVDTEAKQAATLEFMSEDNSRIRRAHQPSRWTETAEPQTRSLSEECPKQFHPKQCHPERSRRATLRSHDSTETARSKVEEFTMTPSASTIPASPSLITSALQEGKEQLHATMRDAKSEIQEATRSIHQLPRRASGALKRLWHAANQPVILHGKRNMKRRPPTKLSLFVTDTIRFGGTFALIFGVLFVGINAQSFWQIARAQLALDTDFTTQEALVKMTQPDRNDSLDSAGSVVGTPSAGLLAALPSVGPYEDRLIIPKLEKNVPIVRPGMDALMKEDWKQFELDIQIALKDGIVHYPGSAKPGQAGNFFLTGHSSYYPWDDGRYKNVFARLNELMPGDTYMVYYGGDRHTYRITKKEEVKPTNVTVLDQPTDRRLSTLMTCTPIGTTLRRLVVIAEEIDPVTGEALQVGDRTTERQENPFRNLGALPI